MELEIVINKKDARASSSWSIENKEIKIISLQWYS